jgi:hypothetical protein
MSDLVSTERFIVGPEVSAEDGRIAVLPTKSLWLLSNGLLGIAGVFLFPQVDALLVFLTLTASSDSSHFFHAYLAGIHSCMARDTCWHGWTNWHDPHS